MSNKNVSVKYVKLNNGTTVQVDKVFEENKLDELGSEFIFHNYPTPFSEDANITLLNFLMIKHFTNYRFDGNLSKQLAQFEMLIESGDMPKIVEAINPKEKRKINDAIKKCKDHAVNIINFIGEQSPVFAAQMIGRTMEVGAIE